MVTIGFRGLMVAALLTLLSLTPVEAAGGESQVKMWVPNLVVSREKDNSYTVSASTLVPSPCYVADGTALGLPPGHVEIPETVPIQLKVRLVDKVVCAQIPWTVFHKRSGITAGEGKTSIAAFVMLADEVKGSSSAPLGEGPGASAAAVAAAGGEGGGGVPTPFSLKNDGSCDGFEGKRCEEKTMMCDHQPGTCNTADAPGTCTTVPALCPEIFIPVCGCNGLTYSNDCFRLIAKVAKDHDGPCGGTVHASGFDGPVISGGGTTVHGGGTHP
jgi:hypothetical protein